jgi:hypothetical protein
MNALAVYVVNQHLSELLAEAEHRRLVRKAKGRGRLASLVAAIRNTLAPEPLPRLTDSPYRS